MDATQIVLSISKCHRALFSLIPTTAHTWGPNVPLAFGVSCSHPDTTGTISAESGPFFWKKLDETAIVERDLKGFLRIPSRTTVFPTNVNESA